MLELAAPAASTAEEQATEAEAGSAAAHALLQGDLLEDIVQEHARCTAACSVYNFLCCILL